MSKKTETFEDEALIPQALEIFKAERKASVAQLQNRLKLGYSRARKLMGELADRKIVSWDADPKTFEYKILVDLWPAAPPEARPEVPAAAYEDRANVMRAEQRAELKAVLSEKFRGFLEFAASQQCSAIAGVNLAREIGQQIELFTGRQKLLPEDFAFLQPALSSPLPAQLGGNAQDAPIEFAKSCLAIHQKFAEPVTSYAVAAPIMEHLMVQLQLLPRPERAEAEGQAPQTGPVLEFLSTLVKAAQDADRLDKQIPIEKWEPFNRQAFITQGKPFFNLYQRALELERQPAAGI